MGPKPGSRLHAALFAVYASTGGVYFLWLFGIEREMFPRRYVALPALLYAAGILYHYVGARSWIEAPKSWRLRLGLVAGGAAVLQVLLLPLLVSLLAVYVVSRAATRLLRLDRLPDSIFRPRPLAAVSLVLFLCVFPVANHLYALHGLFFYLGKVQPPVMMENRFYGVNEARYRGPLLETPRRRAPGSRRLLFLGDSVTFGFGYPAEDAYPQRTLAELAQRGVPGVEGINLGMPSQSLVQIAAKWERYAAFEPDVLLLMTGKHYEKSLRHDGEIREFEGPLLQLEQEWTFAPPLLPEFLYLGPLTAYGLVGRDPDTEESRAANLALYRETLDAFVRRARARRIEVVLLEYPGQLIPPEIDAIQAVIARSYELAFVPTRHHFRSKRDYRFSDQIHPKRRGHQQIAQSIAETLAAEWGSAPGGGA